MNRTTCDALDEFPDDYSWLGGQQTYVVCAFYTSNYAGHARALKRSLELLQVNH